MSRAEKFWDKTAEKYAKSPVTDEATYLRKLAETEEFFTLDMRILELGCGTGTTAIHHAPNVQHIDAIDISENMLEIGRHRAREAGVDNITFTRGTLSEFNADAGSIDAVLALNVIHLVPNRQALIQDIVKILKPSGVFITSTVCLVNSRWRFIKPFIPLGKLLGLMPDLFIIDANELSSEIVKAGFVIERQWFHGKDDIVMFMVARKT